MGRHPPLPSGVSAAEFGLSIMKWGRGDDALKRIETITVEELLAVGMNAAMARAWQDMYREWSRLHPENPSAPFRAELLSHVVALLESKDD